MMIGEFEWFGDILRKEGGELKNLLNDVTDPQLIQSYSSNINFYEVFQFKGPIQSLSTQCCFSPAEIFIVLTFKRLARPSNGYSEVFSNKKTHEFDAVK